MLIACALIGACDLAPDPAPGPTPGIGGTWTVVRIGEIAAEPMAEPRIQFTLGGEVRGETGCSDFEAPMALDGNGLAVGQLEFGYRDPQCGAFRRDQEQAFLAVLESSTRVDELSRGRLLISGSGGEMVLLREGDFEPTADEAALLAQLRTGRWTISSATGLPNDPPLPPLEFAEEQFSAIGRCGITGGYRLRGEELIQLHSLSITEGEVCPAPTDLLRTRLIDSLAAVTHLEIDGGGRVTLRGRDVEVVLERQ